MEKSLTYISNTLKADIKSIKKYLNLKEQQYLNKENEGTDNQKSQDEIVKREQWIQLQKENPTLSLKELRAVSKGLYHWHYRNDKEWLINNSPVKKAIIRNKIRVDWEKRDMNLLEELRKVVYNWNDNEKPIRMTMNSISKEANRRVWVDKYAKKLPLSIDYLKSVSESVEDFQIRRVKIAIENLAKGNLLIKDWLVYKKAGLRPDISSKVKEVITQEIEKYTQVIWKG